MKVLAPEPARNGATAPPVQRQQQRPVPWLAIAIGVLVVAIVAVVVLVRGRMAPAPSYATQPVLRKDLTATVTASGTVNPQDLVSVGTQVSGTIAELHVDYNSAVRAGQVLARIDPTSLDAALAQVQATLAQAEHQAAAGSANAQAAARTQAAATQTEAAGRAALASAESQVDKARASLRLADLTLTRDRTLLAQGYVAQNAVDGDVSARAAAQAALDAATIAVAQARAQLQAQIQTAQAGAAQAQGARQSAAAAQAAIDAARAQVRQASYNRDHSVIVSPVDGTVIARNVSAGQTVAASFQTPTLFSIARDLSKMEVDTAVGEPDIGGLRPGAGADFTVLAYPNRRFHGVVSQVRQNPTTINNVVTYDTVIFIGNGDGALRPGMTANVSITIARAPGALVVPVAALQWAPATGARRPGAAASETASSPWGLTSAEVSRTVIAGRDGRLFVAHGTQTRAVPVRIALVAGTEAAVDPIGAPLAAGDAVVVGDAAGAASSAATPGIRLPIGGGPPRGGSH